MDSRASSCCQRVVTVDTADYPGRCAAWTAFLSNIIDDDCYFDVVTAVCQLIINGYDDDDDDE